jgi:hypothetical protein
MIQSLKSFVINPEIRYGHKELPMRDFLYLLFLDLIVTGICLLFLFLIGLDKSAFHKMNPEEINENLFFFMVMAILLAPPLEEFLFRYYLNYNTKNMWISAVLLFLLFMAVFETGDHLGNSIYFLSAMFVITMLALKLLFGYTSAKILIWGSILSFALYHITNYKTEAFAHEYFIIPLVILPQLIGGVFLAFIRTHYRFIHCILFHAAFNAGVIALSRLME